MQKFKTKSKSEFENSSIIRQPTKTSGIWHKQNHGDIQFQSRKYKLLLKQYILLMNVMVTERQKSVNYPSGDISLFYDVSLFLRNTVYPKKYAHGFCFAVLCCGYTLTDFPISIRLTSLALWQSNDCPSASKATLMNMDKYFMWIHYERLHNHNKAKHNKTVCIFLGIYCTWATDCSQLHAVSN